MLRQTLRPHLRTRPTAHLTQTMSLLELNSEELRQKIENELATNPALDIYKQPRCPHCHRILLADIPCPVCSSRPQHQEAEAIVFVSPKRDLNYSVVKRKSNESEDSPLDYTASKEDLATYVLKQISAEINQDDRTIAAYVLTSLDEDGLLGASVLEIAQYLHVLPSRVMKVIQIIQKADPIGVGSPTPKDALLVQTDILGETQNIPSKTREAIENGLELLSKHAYSDLAKILEIDTAQAKSIAQFIADNLNPYPGRAYWGNRYTSPQSENVYRTPDIIISQTNNDPASPLTVEIFAPYAGYLRVNPKFRQALAEIPEDKAEAWKKQLENANLLLKCVQQRNTALVRLMEILTPLQKRFILEGNAHLIPITRAQLARKLGVHESTVSRAVSNKAVQLPNKRIIPLNKMFDRSLPIRTEMIKIIKEEKEPLSDSRIAEMLAQKGYCIARRTVAKYRSMEGILSARMRKQQVGEKM